MSVEKRTKNFLTALASQQLKEDESSLFAPPYRRLVFIRRLTETLIIALLILGGQQFLIQNTFLSALWPTTGVALSAIFLRGNSALLGILLGSFIGYLQARFPLEAGLSLSLGFMGYIFFIRFLSLKLVGPVTPLSTLGVLLQFFLIFSTLSALHISVLLKILTLLFPFKPTPFNWFVGWLGQINGILCLTPLCLIFDPFVPQRYFRLNQWRWWTGAVTLIGAHLAYLLIYSLPSLTFSLLSFLALGAYARFFGQIPTGVTLLGLAVLYLSLLPMNLQSSFMGSTPVNILLILALFTLTALCSLGVATHHPKTSG